MKSTKTLFGILSAAAAFAMNGHSQVYQLTVPISGYITMSSQDLNGPPGSFGILTNYFNTLEETVYLDTVSNTLRQAGTVYYTPSAPNIQFQETQAGVSGAVTVELGPSGGAISFDTGPQTMTWNAAAQSGRVNSYFPFPISISGSYSLVTGGQTYSNSFAYAINDNEDDDYVAANSFWNVSLTNYPSSIQLSDLAVCCYQGVLLPSPGIVADVKATNGFEMKLSPGIEPYWCCAGSAPGEIFTWSASSATAYLATGGAPCSQPASATATVVGGFLVGATVTDGGCGYTNTPLVSIQGGGGTGAAATAVVSNGAVLGIRITDAGSGYTSAPIIYINFPTIITTQPQSLVVNANDPASFSVTVSGVSLNYQWLLNGTNIPGATSVNLAISKVTQTNLGTYAVVIASPFGSVTSSNATLSMYPFIAVPFTGVVTDWGKDAMLAVEAWGTGPLTYQWFDDGVAVLGATNQVLDLSSLQFTNAGSYSVVISNPLGSVTNKPEQVVVNPAGVSIGLYPGVTISGVVGYNYVIRSTANLSDTNSWVTVGALTLSQPVEVWVDTNVDTTLFGNPQRFYQVLPGQ